MDECEFESSQENVNKSNSNLAHVNSRSNIIQSQKSTKKLCNTENDWYGLNKSQKTTYVIYSLFKFSLFLIFLYIFLLSLNFMTIGFTLVSPYALRFGPSINFLLSNPFASLAIGILATAIIQNATATTSIAVTMVGSGIIPSVKSAIPIIMGSNIGTCVTNCFIALTFSGDPIKFKRAVSAATLNDIFNFLTTIILLSSEILFSLIFILSDKLTSLIPFDHPHLMKNANFISVILNPVCDLFIKIDINAVNSINQGSNITNVALRCCQNFKYVSENSNQSYLVKNSFLDFENLNNSNHSDEKLCQECNYWCMPMLKSFGDGGTGLFWIIFSLITLMSSLFAIVKILSLLISGPIAKGVHKAINASLSGKLKWLTQFVLFFVAFFLTLIVQSSNIITATLVPLCAIGLVSLQRVYVMTLGSNIGTTLTGILSAFTLPASSLRKAMQLALVYTLFNGLGVLFWLPIPFLRFPKFLARKLGNIIFKYKWFLYVYVLSVYFIGPILLLCVALIPDWIGLAILGIPILSFLFLYLIIQVIRKIKPKILPNFLRNFKWTPQWMRSLDFYDKKIKKISSLLFKKKKFSPSIDINSGFENSDFLPNFIRRLSAIDSVVQEAIKFSEQNASNTNPESSENNSDSSIEIFKF